MEDTSLAKAEASLHPLTREQVLNAHPYFAYAFPDPGDSITYERMQREASAYAAHYEDALKFAAMLRENAAARENEFKQASENCQKVFATVYEISDPSDPERYSSWRSTAMQEVADAEQRWLEAARMRSAAESAARSTGLVAARMSAIVMVHDVVDMEAAIMFARLMSDSILVGRLEATPN
jgi:hypothetical protein